MTVVTVELMIDSEVLGSLFNPESPGNFRRGKWETAIVSTMAVSATLISMLLDILGVRINPALANGMDTMRPIQSIRRKAARMTDGTLGDLCRITLQRDWSDIIVRCDRRVFRVRRAVAGGAKHAAVADAETIEVRSSDRHIVIRGESLVGGLPPLACIVESRRVTLARIMTHLAGRLDDPWLARWNARISECAVATGTERCVHRPAFTFRGLAGVAEITGVSVADQAVLIEGQTVGLQDLWTVQGMHVARFGPDSSDSRQPESVIFVTGCAKHGRAARRSLI